MRRKDVVRVSTTIGPETESKMLLSDDVTPHSLPSLQHLYIQK